MEAVLTSSVTEVSLFFFFELFYIIYMRSKYQDPLHILLEYIAKVSASNLCHVFTLRPQ
jgi:hypothetical protein